MMSIAVCLSSYSLFSRGPFFLQSMIMVPSIRMVLFALRALLRGHSFIERDRESWKEGREEGEGGGSLSFSGLGSARKNRSPSSLWHSLIRALLVFATQNREIEGRL